MVPRDAARVELRNTRTSAEEHEAAKDGLRRGGFEVHETRPAPWTYALMSKADLTDMEGLKRDKSRGVG